MTGRTTGRHRTNTKEIPVPTLPTPEQKHAASRYALRRANVAFLAIALVLTAAGAYYGLVWVVLEGVALLLLWAAMVRGDYNAEIDGHMRLADNQARLAEIRAACEKREQEWAAEDAERARRAQIVPRHA
jgi:hypothetical protein